MKRSGDDVVVLEFRRWVQWPKGAALPTVFDDSAPAGGSFRMPRTGFEELRAKGLAGYEPHPWMCVRDVP